MGLEAVWHDGNEAAIGFKNTESCRQMARCRSGIFETSSVASVGRVHQDHVGALGQMGANAGGVMIGHVRARKQVPKDFLTDRIDLVEVKAAGMSGPDSQHSGAGTGFEHHIVRLDIGKMGSQPSEPKWRRKVLMFNLLLAADGLVWQTDFKIIQKSECRLDKGRDRLLDDTAKHSHFQHLEAVTLRPDTRGRGGTCCCLHGGVENPTSDFFVGSQVRR
ncbi:MAG: hypothetical protein ABT10_22475 [Novosphingobium sp. SCN 63-17]|nr:MAG: hypothetical protein ABT10_22475 [Novosphingobium sp. SCN 63-17]OJX93302.1 MAG: hypothetical protein BGP00_05760 [Novosphingobium sp. 63-713]